MFNPLTKELKMNSQEFVSIYFTEEALKDVKHRGLDISDISDVLELVDIDIKLKFPKFIAESLLKFTDKEYSTSIGDIFEELMIAKIMSNKQAFYTLMSNYLSTRGKK